ncbi:transporter substrate-binding domain-containing protein [Clostridium bovifaecis]|uniref:Transporter substrate-binding domain-containing protein n=1 Tax=Clostridium bovifaecis TaxID=2184719 RepID=A0A6I6EPL6_9CLOT|nr:transporter substrate-binding domain-containing protein [Clostridium bovifaecis]
MKKIGAILLTITMGLSLFVGCGEKKIDSESTKNTSTTESKTDNSLSRVKESGKLVIGLDDAYPPMEFRDEKNNIVGFDIDLANEIAKKLGVKLDIVTTEFNGILLALQSKKFDMIMSGLSITDERKKSIGFSEPYVMGGQVIAVKSGNDSIKTLADLKGKTIGCQLGSTGQKAAESNLKDIKELKKYGKITEAFSELAIGRVDAVIMDAQVGGYYISKKPGEFVVLDEMVSEEPMGIGYRKEDVELKDEVQKAVNGLKEDGTLSKLSVKWFGYDAYKK